MSIFKKEPNPVGRPSNEEIKKRRNKKIIIGVIAVVGLVLIGGGAYLLISGTSLSELMGNSVTKTVRVCPNGYIYNKEHKACFVKNSTDGNNARPVKTLNVSSSSYKIQPSYLGEENNLSGYDLYVGSNYINGKPIINNELYSDSLRVELYEINNGKYKKITTMNFEAAKFVQINNNSTKTYVARLVITDAVTGKKVYAPYSKKVNLTPNKISVKPKLVSKKESNTKFTLKLSDKTYSDIEESPYYYEFYKFELYEIVNGKSKLIGTYDYKKSITIELKSNEKKQYKVRLKQGNIYSDYSDVLTINTNKYSS